MWIKICGMTDRGRGRRGAGGAGGRDRLRVSPSPSGNSTRRPRRALARPARGRVRCVAVTRHPTQAALDEIVSVFAPDVLQTDLSDLERLQLPAGCELLPVVRAGAAARVSLPPRVLFEGPVSGSGMRTDWRAAGRLARATQLVLAGGLNADNVAAAIAAVQPFGVDVSSGVEEQPGLKSPLAIANFVAAARAAGTPATRTEDPV